MKRLALAVTVPILAVIVLAMAAWLLAPWWMSTLALARLGELGFDSAAVEFGRPAPGGIRVDRLRIADSAGGPQAVLSGIDVSWRPLDLLEGRISRVTVDSAVFRLREGGGSGAPASLPAALPSLPLAPWLAWIPEQGITVSRAVIARDDGSPIVPPFSFRLTAMSDAAMLVARPIVETAADRVVEVVFDGSGRVDGALAYTGGRDAVLEFSFTGLAEGGQWSAQAASELARLKQWLEPIHAVDLPVASCTAVLHLRLDENPLDALGANLELDDCQAAGMRFSRGSMGGRFMRTGKGVASISPVRMALMEWSMTPLDVRSMVVHSGMDVDFSSGLVTLPQGARVRVDGVDAGVEGLAIGDFEAVVERALSFAAQGAVEPVLFSVAAGEVEWLETSLRLSAANVEVPLQGFEPSSVGILSGTLDIDGGGYEMRVADASADIEWREGRVEARFAGALSGIVPLEGSLDADLDKASGSFRLDAGRVTLGERPAKASDLFLGWPAGIELLSGGIDFSMEGDWDDSGPAAGARVAFDDVGGVAEGVYFSDASTTLDLELAPRLATRNAAELTVAVVDYGVSLRDVTGKVEIDGYENDRPFIVIEDLSARTLGGTLAVARLTSAGTGSFDLALDNIDLAEVAGREQFPGLRIEGLVKGRVPVEIRPEGLYISGGSIENVGGGVVQYDGGDVGSGSSGAEILFRALKDFEYTVLTATPDYRPDGTLVLDVHMEGTSEEIGRDRPIHFNINVEQNLLSLLESIRLVNGLNDRIDKSVQQYYENRQR